MNARAACRLETLGFPEVYRYAPGKADWKAAGLPVQRAAREQPTAGELARRDVPICGLDDELSTARAAAEQHGSSYCLVISDDRVVLGRLRGEALEAPAATPVSALMEEGPTTTRADDLGEDLVERMTKAGVMTMVVTDPDGALIGVFHRSDAEAALGHRS